MPRALARAENQAVPQYGGLQEGGRALVRSGRRALQRVGWRVSAIGAAHRGEAFRRAGHRAQLRVGVRRAQYARHLRRQNGWGTCGDTGTNSGAST